jgi:hypothetical protein
MAHPDGYVLTSLPDLTDAGGPRFDNLPNDPHCTNRYRRFSQFEIFWRSIGEWSLSILPSRPLIQSKQYNSFVGGKLRYYEQLHFDPTRVVNSIARIAQLDTDTTWQIDVHQWRTVAASGSVSNSVPEGAHQDGHDIVAILVIKRNNICGAETTLYNLDDTPFWSGIIPENHVMILNDRKMKHFTSPITSNTNGFRDILVVGFSRWNQKKYGLDFEHHAMSESA